MSVVVKSLMCFFQNLLHSGFQESGINNSDKKRLVNLNFIIILAMLSSPVVGLLHLIGVYGFDSFEHAVNCFVFSVFQLFLMLYLRRTLSNMKLVSYLLILSLVLIFTSNLIFSINEATRLLWFLILFVVTDVVTGYKVRRIVIIVSVIIFYTYFTWPGINTNISFTALISSLLILSLTAILFHYYDEKYRQLLALLEVSNDELEDKVRLRTKDLKTAKEEAENANLAKSKFLANMSHELRTPMHAILSFSELGELKINNMPKEKLLSFFSLIRASGQRLMALLNDLLDLSELETGRMEFIIKKHDFGKLVDSVVDEFNTHAKKKSLDLIVHHPVTVRTGNFDDDKILQVIHNLLSNAVKYTSEGKSITLSYEITELSESVALSAINSILTFIISDQGIGLPEDEVDSIFNKFIQSSKTNTGAGGTGLGLAICKEIINGHGGTISAMNNPDGGAIFKFVIPMRSLSED